MGRAMLIIMAGVIVAVGYIGYGTSEQGKQIIGRNAYYAEYVTAKNAAHTAIQMAFQEMNEDSTWAHDHGKGNPWTGEIEGKSYSLYVDYLYDSPDYWASDTIRVVSTAKYRDDAEEVKVVSIYEINSLDYVPDFKSPLTIATENFDFLQEGNSEITGYDQSGTGCKDKAGITTMSDNSKMKVAYNGKEIKGDPPINSDSTLSYYPTDELIARLENLDSTTKIKGSYKGELGTKDQPGVFFVEESAKLTGGVDEGFGILVVRSGGEMAMEDSTGASLDIAGNFNFNGLVIFENAYDLKGTGTPAINGSVLVGSTEKFKMKINIKVNGNLKLKYDCKAEKHAKKAASLAVKGNKYKRLATFE